MADATRQKNLHLLFQLSIFVKGVDGALETIGGILLLVVSPDALSRFVVVLTQHELSQDPNDWIATSLRHAADSLSLDTKLFVSVYLIGHGVIKLFLVAGLIRERFWAYPTALSVLAIFVLYQLYRFAHTYSAALLAFTAFDTFVASLVWREYRLRKHFHDRSSP